MAAGEENPKQVGITFQELAEKVIDTARSKSG